MGEAIHEVGLGAVSAWDSSPAFKPPFDLLPDLQPPTEEFLRQQEKMQQKKLFENRYVDTIGPLENKPAAFPLSGSAESKAKSLQQSPFADVIVPYSPPFDPEKKLQEKAREPLEVAVKEKAKGPVPIEMPLTLKGPAEETKPSLEAPTMTSKAAKEKTGIFHRFIDWVAGIFGKNSKTDDEDSSRAKLSSPAQRNAEAIRDCLKKLNESLDALRDLVQSDNTAGPNVDIEMATMFLLLMSAVKKHDENKKLDIAYMNKEMLENQKIFKEAQNKYMEALNGTLFLPKLSKWVLKPLEVASTATAIASFGLIGAAVIVGFATGGIGAVLGAIGTVSTYFVVMQALSFIGKGSVTILQALGQYKQNKHKGQMIQARFEQDEASFAIQEEMRRILDSIKEVSKAWENLSGVLEQKNATLALIKN